MRRRASDGTITPAAPVSDDDDGDSEDSEGSGVVLEVEWGSSAHLAVSEYSSSPVNLHSSELNAPSAASVRS